MVRASEQYMEGHAWVDSSQESVHYTIVLTALNFKKKKKIIGKVVKHKVFTKQKLKTDRVF